MRRRRRRSKINTMDKVLVLMGIFLFAFTVTMIVLIYRSGQSFDVLIERVFTACVGEGGFMGAIKIAKVLKGEKIETDQETYL